MEMGKELRFLDDSKKGLDERVGSGVMAAYSSGLHPGVGDDAFAGRGGRPCPSVNPGLHPGLADGALAGLGGRLSSAP